jgi:hypothetical protein
VRVEYSEEGHNYGFLEVLVSALAEYEATKRRSSRAR